MTITTTIATQGWNPHVDRATAATSTVAVSSAPVRRSSRRLVYRGRSLVISSSAAAPRRPSRSSSSTRAGDTMVIAASAAAHNPASGINAAARTSRTMSRESMVASPRPAGRVAPAFEQFVLQPEHLPLLGGFGVVVAQQVEHAVHGQQVKFGVERVPGLAGLVRRDRRAQDHIAEQRGPG